MKPNEKSIEIIVKYKQYLKLEKSLSSNTIDAYLTDLDKLFAYLAIENINYLEVTLENLENFSAGLRDIGIHPRSQARILSGIRAFYHFLVLDNYIQQDLTELLESPQIGHHLPEVLTVEEIDRLIAAIDRSTNEGQRNCAILETLYSCGLRVSELCNLKLSNLYLEDNFIKVEGKGNKQRKVFLPPTMLDPFKRWMNIRGFDEGAIFPAIYKGNGEHEFFKIRNMLPSSINRIVQRRARQANIPEISPHDLRRTFATHMLEAGIDLFVLQQSMGHANLATTTRYDRRGDKAKEKAARALRF